MTVATPAIKKVDPLKCFAARANVRAYLWSIGELDLIEAVDALQAAAVRDGLIQRVGQDEIQAMIADAFWPYWGPNNA